MNKIEIKKRRWARRFLLQGLYQWSLSGNELTDIEAQMKVINAFAKADPVYFHRLFYGIVEHLEAIDAALVPALDRAIDTLNPVELTALRIGVYELLFVLELPFKVVLDEAILLTQTFGAQDGYKYVNGVLHEVAKKCRAFEMA